MPNPGLPSTAELEMPMKISMSYVRIFPCTMSIFGSLFKALNLRMYYRTMDSVSLCRERESLNAPLRSI